MQNHRNAIPDALRQIDLLPDSTRVRLPVVKGLLGCSAATVWRMCADKRLPAPRKISPGCTTWNLGELRRMLADGAK